MGGHLGLRYLAAHPDTFKIAALTAPFLAIPQVSALPFSIATAISGTMTKLAATSYAPGHIDFRTETREFFGSKALSSDPAREALHNYWSLEKPELQIGGVTWGWVDAAMHSCETLQKILSTIDTPMLIARAGREKIVDNKAITNAAQTLPNATLLELPESFHEILMERDEIRGKFVAEFFAFIQSHIE